MRDTNRAPPPHDRVVRRVAGNRGRGERTERRPLLDQSGRRRLIPPVRDDLLDEGLVRGAVRKVRMAPCEQGLRDQRFQTSMRLLGDAVFVGPARRDPRRAHPVMIKHGAEARREVAPAAHLELVGRRRQIVAAQDVRDATERPQRALHAGWSNVIDESMRRPRAA